jgi:hypothetical protein
MKPGSRRIYKFLITLLLPAWYNCHAQVNPDSTSKEKDYEAVLEKLTGHKTIYSLKEALSDPKNVFWLCLGSQNLDTLPKEIMSFPNILGLDISGNNLTSLPKWIGNLKTLREINLRQNKFSSLPTEFFELTNLENIDLWGNKLVNIPKEINRLKHLAELNISANKLKDLPTSFGELNNLVFLAMDLNEFRVIPGVLTKLKNLSRLHLYHNQITDFPLSIINLTKLTELSLDYNCLSDDKIIQLRKLLPGCRINTENQEPSIDYSFFNDIIPQVKKYYKNCRQLAERYSQLHLKKSDFAKYFNELNGHIDSIRFSEMIKYSKAQSISTGTFWGEKLKVIKLISLAKIDSMMEDSSQTIFKSLFFTSMPIFDDKKEYAIIELGIAESMSKGQVSKYLFRKINDHWKLTARFDTKTEN